MAKPNPVAPKTTTAAKFGPGILRGEKCGLASRVQFGQQNCSALMFEHVTPAGELTVLLGFIGQPTLAELTLVFGGVEEVQDQFRLCHSAVQNQPLDRRI